jgi:hypothetical protein
MTICIFLERGIYDGAAVDSRLRVQPLSVDCRRFR